MEETRKSRMTSGLFSSTTDLRATPQDFFDKLNGEFHFTLDPCALPENAKCAKYFTPEEDGLKQDWQGYRVFCNPPYGKAIKHWVKKCHDEAKGGGIGGYAYTRKNGHIVFSRLHLPQSRASFCSWQTKIWECETRRTFPIYGSYL